MRRKLVTPIVLVMVALLCISSAWAQPRKSWKSWYGHIAGGYNSLSGDAGDVADDGLNINGGATYWPEPWPLGLTLELGFNKSDITSEAAAAADATGGNADIWSLTAGAVWSPDTDGKVGFQLSGGIGGYHLDADLTELGLFVGPVCSPWFWWCAPGIGVGDVIVGSVSTTKFGWNGGIGITFELESDSVIYLEAKYHSVGTKVSTEYIPIVIGYRW